MKRMERYIVLGVLFLSLVFLNNCGGSSGGGGSDSGGSEGDTEASLAFSEIVFAEISDADSNIISIATDGDESLTIIGEKDEAGNVTSITGFIYTADDGTTLEFELEDGRPSSVEDADGATATFTNYTATTVDITFYNSDGILIYGPVTTEVDPAVLSQSVQASSSLTTSENSTDNLITSDIVFATTDIPCLDEGLKATSVSAAAIYSAWGSSLLCAISIATVPSGVGLIAVGAACGSALFSNLNLANSMGVENKFFKVAGWVSTVLDVSACGAGPIATTVCGATLAGVAVATTKTCEEGEKVSVDGPDFPKPEPSDKDYWVGVGLSGTGSGKVESYLLSGINCPGDCSESFAYNEIITLRATADEGSELDSFSAGPGNYSNCSGKICVFTVDANIAVVAKFTKDEAPTTCSTGYQLCGSKCISDSAVCCDDGSACKNPDYPSCTGTANICCTASSPLLCPSKDWCVSDLSNCPEDSTPPPEDDSSSTSDDLSIDITSASCTSTASNTWGSLKITLKGSATGPPGTEVRSGYLVIINDDGQNYSNDSCTEWGAAGSACRRGSGDASSTDWTIILGGWSGSIVVNASAVGPDGAYIKKKVQVTCP